MTVLSRLRERGADVLRVGGPEDQRCSGASPRAAPNAATHGPSAIFRGSQPGGLRPRRSPGGLRGEVLRDCGRGEDFEGPEVDPDDRGENGYGMIRKVVQLPPHCITLTEQQWDAWEQRVHGRTPRDTNTDGPRAPFADIRQQWFTTDSGGRRRAEDGDWSLNWRIRANGDSYEIFSRPRAEALDGRGDLRGWDEREGTHEFTAPGGIREGVRPGRHGDHRIPRRRVRAGDPGAAAAGRRPTPARARWGADWGGNRTAQGPPGPLRTDPGRPTSPLSCAFTGSSGPGPASLAARRLRGVSGPAAAPRRGPRSRRSGTRTGR